MLRRLLVISASLVLLCVSASAQTDQHAIPIHSGDVLVIGELHGTQEVPAYVSGLVQTLARSHSVVLGVEQHEDTLALPCTDSGAYPGSWQSPMQDGRTSTSMRDMLCKVMHLKAANPVKIVYLDDRSQAASDLDQAAARKFAAAFTDRSSVGLLLVGNYHSRNSPASIAGALRSIGLTVVTATISTAAKGATGWQCVRGSCGIQTGNADLCNHWSVRAEWIKSPDPRWDYCLVFPTFTASHPAVSNPESAGPPGRRR